jgi:hypothetical protein
MVSASGHPVAAATRNPPPTAAAAAERALATAQANLAAVQQLPGLQGAAAVAAQDAARRAAQEHLLPLNICEGSPDGRWLAVGSDQLCITLLPAGNG